MFGGRYPEEEGVFVYKSWSAWLFRQPALHDASFQKDGSLVRVPAHDNVPIVMIPRRRMIIPVDAQTLQPLNEAERALGHPAAGSDDDKTKNTTIVYIPPYFKLRIAVFLFLIWTTGSILVCSISVAPCMLIDTTCCLLLTCVFNIFAVKLGRNLFAKLQLGPERPIHDLYSFALGAYVMILLSSLLNTVVQKYQIVIGNQGCIRWTSVKKYMVAKMAKVNN